jgi:hypothetical protein
MAAFAETRSQQSRYLSRADRNALKTPPFGSMQIA